MGLKTDLLANVLPLLVVLGFVPPMFLLWLSWKIVTLSLPASWFQMGDDFIFNLYQRLIMLFYVHKTGAQVRLYGDFAEIKDKKERVLYLSNHQSDVDWIVVNFLAIRQGMMGQVRYILKDTLQMIPIFGHALYQHGCIYVKRKMFRQDKMIRCLRYLKKPGIKSWVVLFPEGTRFNLALKENSDLLEASAKYSKDQGVESLNHVLFPRSRGLALTLSELASSFDAVYDITTIYDGTKDPVTGERLMTPTMFEFLKMTKPVVHVHLRRIPLSNLPTSEEDLKKWIYELFLKKDRLLDTYYGGTKGMFEMNGALKETTENYLPGFGRCVTNETSLWQTLPHLAFCVALLVAFLVFCNSGQLYWRTWVFGVIGCYIWLGIRSVA